MSQQGIGAMLHLLGGGSENNPEHFQGRKITRAEWREDLGDADQSLVLVFEDGKACAIQDNGQSCCESRYASTDDDLNMLAGETLLAIEPLEHKEEESDWGEPHEMLFIAVKTTGGTLTIVHHNEHNGYYGGFGMSLVELEA